MNQRTAYETPAVEAVEVITGEIVCTSPLPGGNEGIGYENWPTP